MPDRHFMIEKVISAKADQTVGEVMEMFDHIHIRSVPVCDESGRVVGLFSLRTILLHLLPMAATIENGLDNLDFVVGGIPGLVKKLRKLKTKKISEVMEKDVTVAYSDTHAWEIVRLMACNGSPLPIVNKDTGVMESMISSQTLLHGLLEMLKTMEDSENETTQKQ